MNARRRLATRLLVSVLAVSLVVTVTFAIVAWALDTNLRGILGTAAYSGASVEELETIRSTYLEARGRNKPLLDRYLNWLVDITLFRWGVSPSQGEPVMAILGTAVGWTAAYLVPGTVAAWTLGTAIGLRSGKNPRAVSGWGRRPTRELFAVGLAGVLACKPRARGVGADQRDRRPRDAG